MSTDGFEFNVNLDDTENKYGHTTNLDQVDRDVWDLVSQAIWLAPTGSRIHAIVSSDAGDASGGAGAKTIRVYGLRNWGGVPTSEVVIMNGTTPVNTARSYVIIHRMEALTWGASGPNIGNIKATAADDATITAQIDIGMGQTLMAIYGVGSRHNAFITNYYASIQKSVSAAQAATITLLVNPIPDVETTGFLTKHIQSVATLGSSNLPHKFNPYFRVPGPAIIKIKANGTADNLDVGAGFDVILKKKSEDV